MSSTLARFAAAPLDATARVVTRGLWALAISPDDPDAFLAEVVRAA